MWAAIRYKGGTFSVMSAGHAAKVLAIGPTYGDFDTVVASATFADYDQAYRFALKG